MTIILKLLLILVLSLSILASSRYVARGDVAWAADNARDFLILEEIRQKGFVLIGPRSGAVQGWFHGPAWAYLNFPAFFVGGGNPVTVGWFWVILNSIFVISCFIIGKKLFGIVPGLLFALLASVKMINQTSGFYNAIGAILLVPIYVYTLIRYSEKWEYKYLIAHVLIGGLLIQLQIAVGGPFIVLSLGYVLYNNIKHKKYKHISAFLLLFLTSITYLIFDLRHNFLLSKSGINYLLNKGTAHSLSLSEVFQNRIKVFTGEGLPFFSDRLAYINIWILILMVAAFALIYLKKKNYKFLILWYFWIGFYLISLLQKSDLFYYYYLPIFPLVLMIYFSLSHLNKKVFYLVAILVFTISFWNETAHQNKSIKSIGTNSLSWQFHSKIAKQVFDSADTREIGLFIYSPEVLGYRSKYPLVYQERLHEAVKMYPYEKKNVTYVVIEGKPEYDLPWCCDPEGFLNWTIKIPKAPEEVWNFDNGYQVRKYALSEEEKYVDFDKDTNNWLHFR